MEEFLYGQIPQFLRGDATTGGKTLNSGVLRESQFRAVFGRRIAPLNGDVEKALSQVSHNLRKFSGTMPP